MTPAMRLGLVEKPMTYEANLWAGRETLQRDRIRHRNATVQETLHEGLAGRR